MRRTRAPLSRRHRLALAVASGAVLATPIAIAAVPVVAATAPTTTYASTSAPATDPGDLFNSSTVHDISVEFDQSDYDARSEAYQSTGDKEGISAIRGRQICFVHRIDK